MVLYLLHYFISSQFYEYFLLGGLFNNDLQYFTLLFVKPQSCNHKVSVEMQLNRIIDKKAEAFAAAQVQLPRLLNIHREKRSV